MGITNANPVFSYAEGIDKFFENCKDAGIDAIIMPDVPFEEVDEFREFQAFKTYFKQYSLFNKIFLLIEIPYEKRRFEDLVFYCMLENNISIVNRDIIRKY